MHAVINYMIEFYSLHHKSKNVEENNQMILNDMEKKIRIKDQRGPLVVKFCCYG